jgi:hypothetical protein
MSDAPKERFNVTVDDLRRYDWQTRIAGCKRPEIHSFHGVFTADAESYKKAGDDLGHRVFSLLYVVASFHPNYDAKGNPYGSMWTNSDGSRSLNAEDLTEADLAALGGIVEEIADPEFRARVADVLWVTKKNFEAAKVAVSAFLESAERLKTDDSWPPYAERLERAARISAIRGFEKENAVVAAALEAAVAEFENNPKSGLLCDRLIAILLSLDVGDRARYAALAERLARYFATVGNWHFSENYWQLAEQWHRRAKNDSEVQRCQLAAAECNISNGEGGFKNQGGAMFAATWIGKGLEALRRAKADKARIQAVHRRLLEVQGQIPDEMHTTEVAVDQIPGFRENEALYQKASRKFVSGLDFRTALERFANVAHPTDFGELKKQHAESSKEFIFSQLFTTSSIDHTGKTADVLPPLGTGTPEEQAEAVLKHLYNQARTIQWQMPVAWRIEPARLAIMEEHAVRRGDLMFLVLNNPFIPAGHEGIYLRGIQAGFHGDWLAAMHLLIPQLEASIRDVLQQGGAITSGMRDGIQAEKDLKQLFEMPEFEKMFGPDLLFDLRGILIERFGHNLRNELAHGLLPEGGFYQSASEYLWWLTIHLCWRGFRLSQNPVDPEPNPAE